MNNLPRNNKGRFLKGYHYSKKTEIKKGQHKSKITEIKRGEHRSKKTEIKKGNIPLHKGKTLEKTYGKEIADKIKKAISEASKGKKLTKKHIEILRKGTKERWKDKDYKRRVGKKISLALKGRKKKPLTKKQRDLRRKNMKRWWKENRNTKKVKERNKKISKKRKGYKPTKEMREKLREFNLGRKQSEETKEKRRKKLKGRKKPPRTKKAKINASIKQKALWGNKKYREKQLNAIFKGLKLKPNKPEKFMINLIQKNNLPFKYTGDGKVIIGGFCPDFICNTSKKIIELFGDYWHSRKDWKKRDKRKLKTYKKYGYKTLVVWEHKLKNPNQVLNKITKFTNGI